LRLVLLAFVALVVPALALDALAAGPVSPTLEGETRLAAARLWAYGGQLVVDGTDVPVPLLGQTVGLYIGGVRAAEAQTGSHGRYLIRVPFPVGVHAVETRAFEGTDMEAASRVLTVESYPTYPAEPGRFEALEGFYYTQANVSWVYPWTDGGYPVTSYQVERAVGSGPFATVFTGNALVFVDEDVVPGGTYTYRATATTSYGTSNLSQKTYAASDVISNASFIGFRICDATTCAVIPEGGTFGTTPGANVSIEARVEGIVDHYPIAPPGLPGRTVYGQIVFPFISKNFTRTSDALGAWGASVTGFWTLAPAGGCETFEPIVLARTVKQGRFESIGAFTLCV